VTTRGFVTAGAALGAVALNADPLGMPIGCQVYAVREALVDALKASCSFLHKV
jgi:hypothetical protein